MNSRRSTSKLSQQLALGLSFVLTLTLAGCATSLKMEGTKKPGPSSCARYDLPCYRQSDPWLAPKFAALKTKLYLLDESAVVQLMGQLGSPEEANLHDHFDERLRIAKRILANGPALIARYTSMTAEKSCAVVGSARNLLGSQLGGKIDSHDVVFRINGAPVAGFENDVGTRTDVRISNGSNSIADASELLVLRAPVRALALVPEFLEANTDRELMLSYDLLGNNASLVTEHSTSGLDAIMLAIYTCRKVSLFGFGPSRSGKFDYYYKRGEVSDYHDMGKQQHLIEEFNRRGYVRWNS